MAVHYPKALVTECLKAGLRIVTIDCGSGIRYQGGCTPEQHMDLIQLVNELSKSTAVRVFGPPKQTTIGVPPEVLSAVEREKPLTVADAMARDQAAADSNGHTPPPRKPAKRPKHARKSR